MQSIVLAGVAAGTWDGVFMAPPCASFFPALVPRLRSLTEVEGIQPVPARWTAYLAKHNALVAFVDARTGASFALRSFSRLNAASLSASDALDSMTRCRPKTASFTCSSSYATCRRHNDNEPREESGIGIEPGPQELDISEDEGSGDAPAGLVSIRRLPARAEIEPLLTRVSWKLAAALSTATPPSVRYMMSVMLMPTFGA